MTRKSEKYERFGAADYLDDFGDVAAYLEIALASTDDPTAGPRALGVIARSQNMSQTPATSDHSFRASDDKVLKVDPTSR